MPTTTITVDTRVKERLSLLEGDRTWDEFLTDVIERYPADDAVREMQRRLKELRSGTVKGVAWGDVKTGRGKPRG